jgi:hypothetical protein
MSSGSATFAIFSSANWMVAPSVDVFVGVSSATMSGFTAFVYRSSLRMRTEVSCHHISWSCWMSTLGFGGTVAFSLSIALSA